MQNLRIKVTIDLVGRSTDIENFSSVRNVEQIPPQLHG